MEDAINYILIGMGVVFTIAVPLAIFGLRLQEGLWSNMICFSNITFASLITFNYYEPIAGMIEDAWAGGIFFYDYLVFWLLFSLTFFVLNFVTNKLSQIRVHFPKVVEQVGNGAFLFLIFFNFVSIIFFTLPMAPFQPPDNQNSGLLATIGTEESRSEWFGQKVRLLSIGNLVPFTGEKIWIDPQVYVEAQTNKRWWLVNNAVEKQTMLFEGTPPPRRTD